jgi:hypothetical protein
VQASNARRPYRLSDDKYFGPFKEYRWRRGSIIRNVVGENADGRKMASWRPTEEKMFKDGEYGIPADLLPTFQCRSFSLASTFTIRLRLPDGVKKYTIQWFLGGTGDAARLSTFGTRFHQAIKTPIV